MHLTKSQKLVYDMELYAGGAVSLICGSLLMQGTHTEEALQRAISEIYRRNDALRIKLTVIDQLPDQTVLPFEPREFEVLEFDSKAELDAFAEAYAKVPLDMFGELSDTKIVLLPDRAGVLIKLHHLIADAWTLSLLSNQLNALLQGEEPEAFSYLDHIADEDRYEQSKRFDKDRTYFLEQFRKCPDVTYLSQKADAGFHANRSTRLIGAQETEQINRYAAAHGCSAFLMFAAALSAYLSRTQMNVREFYLGTAVLNRSNAREKNTAGMFVNTAPMLVELDYEKSFAENLSVLETTAFSVFRHQKFNYGDVLDAIRKESGFSGKLYDVMLSYQNASVTGTGIETTWYSCGMQTESLQMHIDDRDQEGIYRIHYDYLTDCFTEQEIGQLHDHLIRLLFSAIEDDNRRLQDLELLSEEETETVLHTFNSASADYPTDEGVHRLFEQHARETPEKIALVAADGTLTFGELNERANRIANALLERQVCRGDIVAVALPRVSSLYASLLGILKAGAAYLPIDPGYPQDRIRYMISQCHAKLCITAENVDSLLEGSAEAPNVETGAKDLFCALHTSGSTGRPKMALLMHGGVRSFLAANQRFWEGIDTVVSATIVTFDAFILDSVLSMAQGCQVVLATEEAIYNQAEFENLFYRSDRNMFFSTPTKLENYITGSKSRQFLSRIKRFVIGGEVFSEQLLNLIRAASPDSRIFNIYGPTEATICVTVDELEQGSEITIGRPVANDRIYITDTFLRPVPVGVVGELCIAGAGVGAGYIHQPELTEEKFVPNPFGDGRMYRTGDLAYWDASGKIHYVGRNDFQVKIRGLRIELGEIEHALTDQEEVEQAVVVARRTKQGRQLLCAFYTGTETDPRELRRRIGKRLPKYMVPHIFTWMEQLPMTTSGKISRTALPEVDESAAELSVEYLAPETKAEQTLCSAAAAVLGAEQVGLLDNFFDLGGDSLKGIQLISRLEQLGYHADTKILFDCETMKDLADHLEYQAVSAEQSDDAAEVPATEAQMRVYTAQVLTPDSTTYNVPYVFRTAHLDAQRLQNAVDGLLERHEILRTRFVNCGGRILQVPQQDARCIVEKLSSADPAAFIRPFDLEQAPLIRVGWFEDTVMIDMHHLITDGGSMPVLLRELNELYMGRTILEKTVPYRSFALSERDDSRDEAYWLDVFRDEVPVLELHTDLKAEQVVHGDAYYDRVDNALHNRILSKCRDLGVTPYVYYMGAFQILLSKFGGSEDVVVGMPISGRSGKYLQTIGMFVNTVALRTQPAGSKTVRQYLQEVRSQSVDAIEHQDYPYGKLVKKLKNLDGRTNLFDVMFAFQSEEMTDVIFGDERAELLPIPVTASKYHFTFNVMPRNRDLVLMVEYCTDLFRESTIARFAGAYQQILEQMLEEKQELRTISALSAADEHRIIHTFNDTRIPYDRNQCIHTLFEQQVRLHPEKTAVLAADGRLSYAELNARANRIAHGLMEAGVRTGDIVAFSLQRRSSLIAVMLGILKAGAAYLPVDPDYPRDRVEYMLTDSGAAFFITEENLPQLLQNASEENPDVAVPARSLCYCIYTSGSTGRPKAVAIAHRNVCNFVLTEGNPFQNAVISRCDSVFATNAVVFDITVQDILLPLTNGLSVIFARTDTLSQTTELLDQTDSERIALIVTPTKLQMFMQSRRFCESLNRFAVIMVGAENFPPHLLRQLRQYTDAVVFNGYGPTETTCGVLYAQVEEGKRITIGKPVANTNAYILDSQLRMTPIGVSGELCIAGDSVGMGYLHRDALNAERFLDNPFGPGKLYRTGDVAYWQEDGNVVYVGRNDFQVKIRGLRIELGEIENAICAVEGVTQAVVLVRRNDSGRQIICAFYTGQEQEPRLLRQELGQRLPKYMLPHIFTHLDSMPMTAGGKVSRKALPPVDLYNVDFTVEYVQPETKEEILLAQAVSSVLGTERVGLLDHFFDLGGDSLKALELISRLEQDGYRTDSKTIFASETIRDLAAALEPLDDREEETELETGDLPATPAQMRVYTAQEMSGENTSYNVTFVFRAASLRPDRLQNAVDALVKRHEILRTCFRNIGGQILQVVQPDARCTVEQLASDDITAFVRPFDLTEAPLLRVGVYETTVMVDMHHIITDGSSMPVFLQELNELYMGRSLPHPTVPYRRFAMEHQDHSESEAYWTKVYREVPEELEFNTDFRPGKGPSVHGAGLYDLIPLSLHQKIQAKSKALNMTPYVFYMSAFNLLLSKFSGSEDVVVGMPVSGRSPRYLHTIGMFVNTIALRNYPAAGKTVGQFLTEVRDSSVKAIEHQDYPYGDLVKKLKLDAGGRNPLFRMMLAYQSEEMTEVFFGDQRAELLQLPITTAKYDLTLSVLPRKEAVVLVAEYCTDLYRESTIQRMLDGYKQILEQLLDGTMLLRDVKAQSPEAEMQVLRTFNATAREYPSDRCLHQLFEQQVLRNPDHTALIAPDRTLTYAELNEEANRLAHALIDDGVQIGDVVGFALPRSSHMIALILAILKAGAAYVPVDPEYPADRVRFMMEDSHARMLVTPDKLTGMLTGTETENPNLEIPSSSLCYCIYTSGSTGKPKGTLLRHSGLVNLVTDLSIYGDMSRCSRIGLMTTITFDVASQEIFTALLNGLTGVLMPERRETRIEDILQGVAEQKIDVLYATPTYLDSLTSTDERAALLASSVRKCVLAGEGFYINDHLAKQKQVSFLNQYGPAETHVATAAVIRDLNDVHIGTPIANTQIYILDRNMHPVPVGVTGELCIAGDCVGAGYLNRPDLNRERFPDNPFGPGKLYRTGDLAFWRTDGAISYIGRNDFQVKIRGQRIELGEIESTIVSLDGIAQAAVVVRKNAEGRQLICAFYTGRPYSVRDLRQHIGKTLPKYMIPHIFTHLEQMPLTGSGKISRTTLPEVDLYAVEASVAYAAPETEQERVLADATARVLGIEKVGMLDNFFDLGGDSLKAIELISRLEESGLQTDTRTIFRCDTFRELAAALTASSEEELQEAEIDGDIPATPAQMRIYTAQSMNPDTTTYNVPYFFKAAQLDPRKLQRAVNILMERHEILRTRFENRDGRIYQVIEPSAVCRVEKMASDDLNCFMRPFDMSQAPLMRVGYYDHIVMIDMHHTITDGGSWATFLHELNELYMGRELTQKPVQYKQFAVLEPDDTASEGYWLEMFREEPPVLEMNTDFRPVQNQTFHGSATYGGIRPELHREILKKCRDLGVTPYMYYLAAYNLLLSKYSGHEDIVVGVPISGRSSRFLNALGMFVNTVAIRNRPKRSRTLSDFLQEVRNHSVDAIAHQDYPFGELVKKLHLNAAGRNPLFDVMFVYQSEETTDVIFGDEKAELVPMPVTTSKYDFTFNVLPQEEGVVIMVEYSTDLYREETIQRLLASYRQILTQMTGPDCKIGDISAVTPEQQEQLQQFNSNAIAYPRDKCIHHYIEELALSRPADPAVIAQDGTLTFDELNRQANRVAHGLQARGIGRGAVVGICLPRTTALIVCMLGVIKAGAAYLPIDPNYPEDRIRYMLTQSGAELCLTAENAAQLLNAQGEENLNVELNHNDTFCALHTSGSTGKPKMATLLHGGLANFLVSNHCYWEGVDTVVSATIITFDAFTQDSLVSIAAGCKLVLASEEAIFNQSKFEELFRYSDRNLFFSTPTKLENYINVSEDKTFLSRISNIAVGGEVFTDHLLQTIRTYAPNSRVFNGYGPTETTICTVVDELEIGREITIGRPIANTQIHILDADRKLCPIGVTGELCIAGDGVGGGYINQPELTAKAFVENPFGSGKLYRTGDLAYWNPDGTISFVGRNDFQVKIRGLRIELGEIENALNGVEGIRQSVVVVRKNSKARQLICAFYSGEEVDARAIRIHIGRNLPKYMIPHVFTHMDALPLTSSGKVDRKLLPEVDLETIANDQEYVAPRTGVQSALCKLLEQVLDLSPVGIQDDFFDLGGDSLKAIEFVSKAHNEGIYFNLQNVFDYPNAEQLAAFIENGDAEMVSFADCDFTKIHQMLRSNCAESMEIPDRTEVGNILLSGATGYLGIHVLENYLTHDTGTAYCLVRGKDPEQSRSRLETLLKHYFAEETLDLQRVVPLCADLSQEHFGLEQEVYENLLKTVDTVIHTAASVKHFGSYRYFYETNVESTKRVIAFCRESGAKLIHTSTLSISGTDFVEPPEDLEGKPGVDFTEQNFYMGQQLDNVYIRSKFEAEREVLEAMTEGLQANIMRIGNLTNRYTDGMFQSNHTSNAFLRKIRSILALGVFPEEMLNLYMEFTPVDQAAAAVMTALRHFNTRQTVFHITNVKLIQLGDLGTCFTHLGYGLKRTDSAAFTAALRESAKNPEKAYILESFINDLDENDQLSFSARIYAEGKYTAWYLRALGFEWGEIDEEYIRKYVEYFEDIGYLEKQNEKTTTECRR